MRKERRKERGFLARLGKESQEPTQGALGLIELDDLFGEALSSQKED